MTKTKNYLAMAVLVLVISISMNSCKKETCADALATNFNDEGDCQYPADVLVGSWTVKETPSGGSTTTYTSSITKVNNNEIKITDTRTPPGTYNFNSYTFEVDWTAKTLDLIGAVVNGNIVNNDSLTIEFSTAGGSLSQTYKRK